MFNFIKNLFRKQPTYVRPAFDRGRNTKHAWANDAISHVTGVGAFMVNIPEAIDPHLACDAIRARLASRFGNGRYKTRYMVQYRAIQVTIK